MHVTFAKRFFSGLLAALMTVSFSLGTALAAVPEEGAAVSIQTELAAEDGPEEQVTILQDSLTPADKSLEVSIGKVPASGILRVIQLDAGETYDSAQLNAYTSLSGVVLAGNLQEGTNTIPLSTPPTVGKQVLVVLRDSSGEDVTDIVSAPIVVVEEGSSGGSVLDNCSVAMVKDGPFQEDDRSVQVQVKLDKSIEQCYLTIFAYAGNTAFDPDASFNKRLWSGAVSDGDERTCTFSELALPLIPGYKVIACLNVPVGEDNYRSVVSQAINVVDEGGGGFEDYVYPDATIDETVLEAGATSLHISLTGDKRLFQAVQDKETSIICAVAQYPEGEDFDFEAEYMISLLNNYQATEAFSGVKIHFPDAPLRAGYRVRAVVYWSQNPDIFLPKGNDYEEMFHQPDDSVLIPAAPAAPSVAIQGTVKEKAESLQVAVGGELPEDSVLILQRFPKEEAFVWQGNGEFIANKTGLASGTTHTVAIPAENQSKLDKDYKLIAVVLSGGQVVAQSEPVEIQSQTVLDPFVLEPVGTLLAESTEAVFRVRYDASITTGRLILCGSTTGGQPDSDNQIASAALTQGDAVTVSVPAGKLQAGDTVFACLYYLQPGTEDFYKSFYSEPIVVQAEAQDSVSIRETSLTPSSKSATVVVSGCADFMGGRLILAAGRPGADADSRRQIYSQPITAPGTVSCAFSSGASLKAGEDVLPYLYYYDAENDRALYKYGDPVSVLTDGGQTVEPKVEIATSTLRVGDESAWITTQFDSALTGQLSVYSYAGESFDPESIENVLLYQGAASPSENSQKVNFDRGNLPLVQGRRVIAALTLSGGETPVLYSAPLVVQAQVVIPDPTVTINEKAITEGDTKMRLSVSYDRDSVDEARYTAYLYEGDTLDKDAPTTKILSSNSIYNTSNTYVNFNSDFCPLKVGAHIQVILTVTDNGGTVREYASKVLTVGAAPDWDTPTAAFEESAAQVGTASLPATIRYDEGYLEMEDYYCNATVYQFPGTYTDEEFQEQELFENPKIAQRVGDLNSTVDQIVRGQVEIPVRSDVTLTEGSRLIIKLRLPHPEWEGEEADYFSYSIPVVAQGSSVPTPKVLLYNLGPDTSRGERVRGILQELGIETLTIQKTQLNELVGYLAGLDGFEASDEPYTGDGYNTEFMLMSHLGEAQLDRFLAAMQAQNLRIDHKAVVTAYNQNWTMKELIGEIGDEHDIFQALLELDRLVAKAGDLQESDFAPDDWAAFQKVVDAANEVLSSYEPTLERLQGAINDLTRAYASITGQSALTGRLVITAAQAADGTYTLAAHVADGPEGAVFQYVWNDGTTGATLANVPADRLVSVTVEATADNFFGTLQAQLKTPDAVQATVSSAVNGEIVLQWTAPAQKENQPENLRYTAEVFAGDALLQTVTANGDATRLTIQGLQNGTAYTVKLYAENAVGRSDRLALQATPEAKSSGGSSSSRSSSSMPQTNLYGAEGILTMGVTTGAPGAAVRVISDTTVDFTMKKGGAYCFKITVPNGQARPNFTVGNGSVLKTQFVEQKGNDYYYRIYAVGMAGQSTGVYTTLAGQSTVKHCAVKIA